MTITENKNIMVDLFCGGGGASEGIKRATGREPDLAVNHDEDAIEMHKANHPRAHHEQQNVWYVRPSRFRNKQVQLLWLSPDCRHFSRSKGGKPVSTRVRSLARSAIPWAKLPYRSKPELICLENVSEFQEWGPLRDGKPIQSRKGELFKRFVADLEKEGYNVDYKVLNAADCGAPTARKRLVLVAKLHGEVQWPEPTHGPRTNNPYRTAAECVDWSIPTKSIFDRKKPLAEKTQARLARGFVRYVVDNPEGAYDVPSWALKFYGTSTGQDLSKPLSTVSAQGQHHALCQAWIAKHYGGVVGQKLQAPLGTVTAVDHHSLCTAHAGDEDAKVERVVAWIERYYSSGGHSSSLRKPMPTITTIDRMSLVIAFIRNNRVVDIRLRMFTPRELARAMGFPDTYVLTGTKRSQIARIGNAVCPAMAEAVVRANWRPNQLRVAA
jgi:DNA (cytosine-5)-methyltransferase 1